MWGGRIFVQLGGCGEKKVFDKSMITALLPKIKGKIQELAVSHATSRVIQTCVRFCKPEEREAIFAELRPHALEMARNTYAHFLVNKMLVQGNEQQKGQLLSTLRRNVVPLLRHPCGSSVIEQAYQSADSVQQMDLVAEFYAPEFQLFKDALPAKCSSLKDIMAEVPPLKKGSILQHLTLSLQPIVEKGIVDHSIVHRVISEYFTVCTRRMMKEVVEQLAGPLLVRMIHTKDGAFVGSTCVAAGSVKERKKIIKGMKGHVVKICLDKYGHLIIMRILDVVDDTKLVGKIVISEIMKELKTVAMDRHGKHVLLHILAPRVKRYFSPDILGWLQPFDLPSDPQESACHRDEENDTGAGGANTVRSSEDAANGKAGEGNGQDSVMKEAEVGDPQKNGKKRKKSRAEESGAGDEGNQAEDGKGSAKKKEPKGKKRKKGTGEESDDDDGEDEGAEDDEKDWELGVSKKDPELRRLELLRYGGLAKKLVELCEEHAEEMLKDKFAADIIFEVANGGLGGVMWKCGSLSLQGLKETIAGLAAMSKTGDASAEEEKKGSMKKTPNLAKIMMSGGGDAQKSQGPKGADDPILEHYFASRTLRRLVMECQLPPSGTASNEEPFPAVLWRTALAGRCKELVQGHSAKVVASLLSCPHEETKAAAMKELKPLIDSGALDQFKQFFESGGDGDGTPS
ncbi:hypothetical protein CBR_g50950 [Chara braunii]|uniref:PUM-HD domain-containing protein n=1 Tax=Chara braunii TaxID=69332 RepID=A0A388M7U2_CHABU|nr:hypothetical protein CBR_g50950 [Chara braunii]|eukprot:GBG90606.1 hypothetical protein CBR_g50950 [Chara braunii]